MSRSLRGSVAVEMGVGVLMVLQVEQREEVRVPNMEVLHTGHIHTGGIIKFNLFLTMPSVTK